MQAKATIKYLADTEAGRRYGINTYVELAAESYGYITYAVRLLPFYRLGYITYDIKRERFI